MLPKKQAPGWRRLYRAAIYSYRGFRAGWRNEAALRQELPVAVALTAVTPWLAPDLTGGVLMVLLPWLTVVTELLNSAIEAVVDRIGPEYHELSGRAKDLGSAAVLVMLILTGGIWAAYLVARFAG